MTQPTAQRARTALVLATLLCGCGQSRQGSSTLPDGSGGAAVGARAGASNGGGVPGAGGADGTAGVPAAAGAPLAPPFEVRKPDAAAACDPAACAVVGDWEALETDADTFNEFHLATSADTTYLTLDTRGIGPRHRLIALDARGEVPINQGPIAPLASPLLRVDAEGSPHVVGKTRQPPESTTPERVREWILSGVTWQSTSVNHASRTRGFEIDPADRAFVHSFDDSNALALATREGDTWTSAPLPPEADGTFGLDVTGEPVFLAATESSLSVVDPAGALVLAYDLPHPTVAQRTATAAFAATQPQPIAAGSADLAIALLLDDGLHVLLVDRGGGEAVDAPIPDSKLLTLTCPDRVEGSGSGVIGAECAPSCSLTGSGLAPAYDNPLASDTFALARTTDGTLWLAYVIFGLELTSPYTWHTNGLGKTCEAERGSSTVTSVLHVARIAPDGSAVAEALTAPLGPTTGAVPTTSDTWTVLARAFGQRVAVGVALRPGNGLAGARVTTFDAVE